MHDDNLFPHQRLDVYRVARELLCVVFAAKLRNADLRDQAERAARSVLLQLSEGLPSDRPAMRRNYFERARDSLFELVAVVDVAELTGAMDATAARDAMALTLRLRPMLVALMRSARR